MRQRWVGGVSGAQTGDHVFKWRNILPLAAITPTHPCLIEGEGNNMRATHTISPDPGGMWRGPGAGLEPAPSGLADIGLLR